jgi:hypothetical protein
MPGGVSFDGSASYSEQKTDKKPVFCVGSLVGGKKKNRSKVGGVKNRKMMCFAGRKRSFFGRTLSTDR